MMFTESDDETRNAYVWSPLGFAGVRQIVYFRLRRRPCDTMSCGRGAGTVFENASRSREEKETKTTEDTSTTPSGRWRRRSHPRMSILGVVPPTRFAHTAAVVVIIIIIDARVSRRPRRDRKQYYNNISA